MRNLALSVAAILLLAVASPAFAQPFADVPTDHWAFDAIAELAAKGIIEGFPDGTFKGDRGVSRYEVAMIVARILARIEAIKIPAPMAPAAPAPQVTRADVQTIQRLVNEFRAELAALGVRTTAVEEELTALKSSVSATKVSGDVRFRYNTYPNPVIAGGLGAGTAGGVSESLRDRVTFTGTVSPNVKMVTRFRTGSLTGYPNGFSGVSSDRAYLDAKLLGFQWRAGTTDFTLGSGVGWSGYGLLFDPSNAGVNYLAAGTNAVGYVSGLTLASSFAGFNYQLGAWNTGTTSMNIYTVHAGTVLSGWNVELNAIYQQRQGATAVPITASGPTSGLGVGTSAAANTNDTGYEVELTGALFPGLTLGAGYATFNPNTGPSSNAYIGWLGYDLSPMGMAGWKATWWYKNYGSTTAGAQIPYWSGANTEGDFEAFTAWNFNGFGVALDTTFGGGWDGSFSYESGNQTVSGGPTVVEYQAIIGYALAPNTRVSFNYFKGTLGGAGGGDYDAFYRLQLTTSY